MIVSKQNNFINDMLGVVKDIQGKTKSADFEDVYIAFLTYKKEAGDLNALYTLATKVEDPEQKIILISEYLFHASQESERYKNYFESINKCLTELKNITQQHQDSRIGLEANSLFQQYEAFALFQRIQFPSVPATVRQKHVRN